MKANELAIEPRTETGKGPNRRLRAAGRIPANIYGNGFEPVKCSVDAHTFTLLVRGVDLENTFFSLKCSCGCAEGKGEMICVAREAQRDPVTRAILHVDFYKLDMTVETEFEVPVSHTGTPAGVREGGFLEQSLHHIAVRCVPTAVPSSITVDISELRKGTPVYVGDLPVPAGVKVVTDAKLPVFSVVAPEEEEVVAEESEESQPEVISRKKKDEE